jgi:hypothetical protein
VTLCAAPRHFPDTFLTLFRCLLPTFQGAAFGRPLESLVEAAGKCRKSVRKVSWGREKCQKVSGDTCLSRFFRCSDSLGRHRGLPDTDTPAGDFLDTFNSRRDFQAEAAAQHHKPCPRMGACYWRPSWRWADPPVYMTHGV